MRIALNGFSYKINRNISWHSVMRRRDTIRNTMRGNFIIPPIVTSILKNPLTDRQEVPIIIVQRPNSRTVTVWCAFLD